ncbi:uncharacterized protein RHO25_004056 [Cercospora beticola]|uniref:Uncharacterized protein n=1 Tax=Cercospora beticola TaxID=122368 RepID=A0ABZ0NIR1_CERBT|nr:hypothetical protein RHO25_004056 [Cercospora beticola]
MRNGTPFYISGNGIYIQTVTSIADATRYILDGRILRDSTAAWAKLGFVYPEDSVVHRHRLIELQALIRPPWSCFLNDGILTCKDPRYPCSFDLDTNQLTCTNNDGPDVLDFQLCEGTDNYLRIGKGLLPESCTSIALTSVDACSVNNNGGGPLSTSSTTSASASSTSGPAPQCTGFLIEAAGGYLSTAADSDTDRYAESEYVIARTRASRYTLDGTRLLTSDGRVLASVGYEGKVRFVEPAWARASFMTEMACTIADAGTLSCYNPLEPGLKDLQFCQEGIRSFLNVADGLYTDGNQFCVIPSPTFTAVSSCGDGKDGGFPDRSASCSGAPKWAIKVASQSPSGDGVIDVVGRYLYQIPATDLTSGNPRMNLSIAEDVGFAGAMLSRFPNGDRWVNENYDAAFSTTDGYSGDPFDRQFFSFDKEMRGYHERLPNDEVSCTFSVRTKQMSCAHTVIRSGGRTKHADTFYHCPAKDEFLRFWTSDGVTGPDGYRGPDCVRVTLQAVCVDGCCPKLFLDDWIWMGSV